MLASLGRKGCGLLRAIRRIGSLKNARLPFEG